MDVACTEDGMFAFGGVSRGSVELVAVDLSQIELHHDNSCTKSLPNVDILDLIQVYRHSDAKLKGFGACTRLRNNSSDPDMLKYLLLTGKGIKVCLQYRCTRASCLSQFIICHQPSNASFLLIALDKII
jgi:hypothetical protein